jgi:hypothetical protein
MPDKDEVFENLYEKWRSFIQKDDLSLSSLSEDYINNEHFQAIVDLGLKAIPFIIQKLQTDENAHFLIYALEEITKHSFNAAEIAIARDRYGGEFGNQLLAKMWQEWWNARYSSTK